MWKWLLRKVHPGTLQTQQQPASATNIVEEIFAKFQGNFRNKDFEHELAALDRSNLTPIEAESWWYCYGAIAFQKGNHAAALERFEEAFKQIPTSSRIRYALGQEYLHAKRIDRAFELFRTCKFPEISCEFVLAQARYAYLWNRYDDGLHFIRPFFQAYQQLGILDDTFLDMRGLPFFGRWWRYMMAFAVLTNRFDEIESATQYVQQNCSDYL